MKVQFYEDDGMARVFDRTGNGLCDVWSREIKPTTAGIDAALKLIKMRRVSKWKHYRLGGFREATVRFDSKPPSLNCSV